MLRKKKNNRMKKFLWAAGLLLVILLVVPGLKNNSATERVFIAEAKVEQLEKDRQELELELDSLVTWTEELSDSLDGAQDSLAVVREDASRRVSRAASVFSESVGVLRDSLVSFEGLEAILDTIEASHQREIVGYQDQIRTLEEDKAILWQRVESLDSLWVQTQRVNDVLRAEVVALNEKADAWEDIASPNLLKRLRGGVPYVLVGALVTSLIMDGPTNP